MSKEKPGTVRVISSIIVGFGWLLFVSLWLIFYATTIGIIQNIGVLLASLVVAALIEVIIWVPWAMKHE